MVDYENTINYLMSEKDKNNAEPAENKDVKAQTKEEKNNS